MEIINHTLAQRRIRSVLFDFDGTLSLIRAGWPDVMIPMMVRILQETPKAESVEELQIIVEDFVMRLNGRQTIYQMIQLAEEVENRGGAALDPLAYKHQYHEALMDIIRERREALAGRSAAPEEWTVPGSHELLRQLQRLGLTLYLASGTDFPYVREEAELLDLTPFFGDHIYGALDDYKNFSKKMIIERILADNDIAGEELLAFGDGFVEIEETKRCGGVAVAVASNEIEREGVNEWKRQRLIRAGADVVIADYRNIETLLALLFEARNSH